MPASIIPQAASCCPSALPGQPSEHYHNGDVRCCAPGMLFCRKALRETVLYFTCTVGDLALPGTPAWACVGVTFFVLRCYARAVSIITTPRAGSISPCSPIPAPTTYRGTLLLLFCAARLPCELHSFLDVVLFCWFTLPFTIPLAFFDEQPETGW